jgi:hypothetical protein
MFKLIFQIDGFYVYVSCVFFKYRETSHSFFVQNYVTVNVTVWYLLTYLILDFTLCR